MPEAPRGAWFWTLAAIGWIFIVYGGAGLLRADIDLLGFATWFVGGALVHDLLLAPIVLALAWVLTRWLPRPFAVPVKVGLAASALIFFYAWPLVRGYGRRATLPSALPLDYGRNLALALLFVWIVVAGWTVQRSVRSSRGRA
jgi:hypothetical protein